jgi:hypothetical protein
MAMTGLASSDLLALSIESSTTPLAEEENITLPEGSQIQSGEKVQGGVGSDLLAWLWKPMYSQNLVGSPRKDSISSVPPAHSVFSDADLHEKATKHIRSLMTSESGDRVEESVRFSVAASSGGGLQYPQLQKAAQPAFQIVTMGPELAQFLSTTQCGGESDWAMQSVVNAVRRAVSVFNQGGQEQTANILNDMKSVLCRIGGSRVHRDVVTQTLIEAMLRSERWTDARLLLSERTALAPNDAQAWRRQASVLGRLGHQDLAAGASYTAWQLGIGQGGFGGPR